MKKRLRPLGNILLELEPLLLEMGINHDLQWGDILGLIYNYLVIHLPNQQEEYLDNTNPIYYYGPKENK